MVSFNEVLLGVGIGVTTTVIATGITFYIKDYLKERAKFKKFKEKFEQIAGKNASVIIPNVGQVKIVEINKQGVVVENQLCKTFIPIDKVFNTEISLPVENYEKKSKELMVKSLRENLELIFPPLMDKMKEVIVQEFLDDESKISGVVAFQVKSQLKEQGYAIKDKEGETTPTFKQIADHYEKRKKGKKS
jgi:hypothetical protein